MSVPDARCQLRQNGSHGAQHPMGCPSHLTELLLKTASYVSRASLVWLHTFNVRYSKARLRRCLSDPPSRLRNKQDGFCRTTLRVKTTIEDAHFGIPCLIDF